MKDKNSIIESSYCKWYPLFKKHALEAEIIPLPEDVCKYLELDSFLLPLEATSTQISSNAEWTDGTLVNEDSEENFEEQPTFPNFSRQLQEVINKFSSVFIKLNWKNASDATWITATKTLQCNSLEDIYLLLKSSDRVSHDLSTIKCVNSKEKNLNPVLVLKRWCNIDPGTEFRCFVVNKKLVGICQRDISQYYKHIENERYDIQGDIKSLFLENIKDRYLLNNYSFDVIRFKKDKVKIVDFGLLNELFTKDTLFTLEELCSDLMSETPEFRFIAEDMGIQPKSNTQFCIPQEINEFFQASGEISVIDNIRKKVEKQGLEKDVCTDQTDN